MVKNLMLLGMLLSITIQKCQEGCLKCTQDDSCEVCDLTNFYTLTGLECEKVEKDNCVAINLEGQCLYCIGGFFLDKGENLCVEVEEVKIKDNCLEYDFEQNCLICEQERVIVEGVCKEVNTIVSHCAHYIRDGECEGCELGYLLTHDNKCANKPNPENCQFFGIVSCTACDPNYLLNSNLYLKHRLKLTSHEDKIATLNWFQRSLNGNGEAFPEPICEKKEVSNCEKYQNFNDCELCNSGYYLKEKKCYGFPKPQIHNCNEYTSETICSECVQGFFLKSNTCEKVVPVNNCSKYNPRATSSACQECSADYFLSGLSCSDRVTSKGNLIENCEMKSINEDSCSKCASGYEKSSSGANCVVEVPNCKQHSAVADNAEKATCKFCDDEYYLNSDACEVGNIDNCLIYTGSTTCDQCKNGYYLADSSTCSPSNNLKNCEIFDGARSNKPHTCDTCNNDSFNFKIEKYCVDVSVITNCVEYDRDEETETCLTCDDGFFLSESECVGFTDSNCIEGSDIDTCTICAKGFSLDSTGDSPVCKTHFEFMLENCANHEAEENNSLDVAEVGCNYCKPNHLPWSYSGGYVCIANENLLLEGIAADDQLDECAKYGTNQSCIECNDGYYLSDEDKCVDECPDDYAVRVISIQDDVEGIKTGTANVCVENDENCALIAPITFGWVEDLTYTDDDNDDDNYLCMKCKDGFAPIFVPDDPFFSVINTEYTSLSNVVLDPFSVTSHVECLTPSKINGSENADLIDNCEYYIEEDESMNCKKCKFGYHGVTKGEEYAHIESCTQMSACDTATRLYGLPWNYAVYNSCEKCLDDNKIPFIGIHYDEEYVIEGILEYDLDDEDFTTNNAGNLEPSVSCQNPLSPSSFGDGTKFTSFPDFCGYGAINLKSTDGDNTDNKIVKTEVAEDFKIATFCGACKPGYAPTYMHADLKHIVVSCTSIDHCSKTDQKYFNRCSQCESGYTLKYDTDTIDYVTCVKHKSENCFAAEDQTDNNDGPCKICKKGYFMNLDQRCEELKAPKCATAADSNITDKKSINLEFNYQMYAFPRGNGCNKCIDGFSAVYYEAEGPVCSSSPYITQNANNFLSQSDETATNYINYCEGYSGGNDELTCETCSTGYVLNETQKKCLNTVVNCKIVSGIVDEKCAECLSGFALVNEICVAGTIANCEEYFTNENKTSVKCKECSEGFFIESDQTLCAVGLVANCELYQENDGKKCQTCKDGYTKLEKTVDVCYPIDESLNCSSASLGTEVRCLDCKLPNQVYKEPNSSLGTDENQTICMNHNLIPNCLKYDIGNDINSSTFQCTECDNGYYINDYKCEKRLNILANCTIYHKTEDKCDNCSPGNYSIDGGQNCEAYPKGIIGCETYSDETTCIGCKGNRILDEGVCDEIVETIDNCISYLTKETCKECANGFFLTTNTCDQANVQNCLTYTSIDECATCPPNYGLKTDINAGKTDCVPVNKANCISFEPSGLFPCTHCSKNYYPNIQGECILANPLIAGCEHYESNALCLRCESNLILSEDSKSCLKDEKLVEFIDPNCFSSVMKPTHFCTSCLPGYYFNNGVCKVCEKNGSGSGCFTCDPENLEVCHICSSGYYQSKDQSCTKIPQSTDNNNDDNNDGEEEGYVILSTSIFTFFMIIFFGL